MRSRSCRTWTSTRRAGSTPGTSWPAARPSTQGLICESGTVEDTRLIFAGFQSPTGRIQIPVRKTFTCDDGSGEIFIKIQVHLDLNTQTETFSWVVLGGTGDYSDLHGSGGGTTVGDGSDPQTGNFNNYVGFLIG